MKNYFLLLGSSLLLAGTAHAQAGLRAGGILTHLAAEMPPGYLEATNTAKLGYQVGFFYQMPLTKRLSLLPEVQFSRECVQAVTRHNNFAIMEYFGRSDSRLAMSYLNVPVLLRAAFGAVYVEAGPQGSVLLGGREEGASSTSFWDMPIASTDIDRPLPSYLHRFDVGPCLGVGVKLPAGLGVSVRAYQGLVSMTSGNDNTRPYPYYGSLRRQTLQASLTCQLAAR